jgi:hypothetical protein
MVQEPGVRAWRTVAFVAVYGLTAVAVTALYWGTPQPTADVTGFSTSIAPSAPMTSSATLPDRLQTAVPLSVNAAYGISGTARFENPTTVVLSELSITSRGPTVQVELRDQVGATLATLKDLSKLSLTKEDQILVVAETVDVSRVTELAIVAPDYGLVLSRARWTAE